MLLERAGAIPTCVSNAMDALAEPGPFDLILSDIGMPGMDGYAFMQAIRSRQGTRRVPSIALTAFTRREDRERALTAGYQEHLTKPIDINKLLLAIKGLAKGTEIVG